MLKSHETKWKNKSLSQLASIEKRNDHDNLLADASVTTNVLPNSSITNENMMIVDVTRDESTLVSAESYPHANENSADENGHVANDVAVAITTKSTLNPRKNRRYSNYPSFLRLAKQCKGQGLHTYMFVSVGNMTVIDKSANESIKKCKKEADHIRQRQKRASC